MAVLKQTTVQRVRTVAAGVQLKKEYQKVLRIEPCTAEKLCLLHRLMRVASDHAITHGVQAAMQITWGAVQSLSGVVNLPSNLTQQSNIYTSQLTSAQQFG